MSGSKSNQMFKLADLNNNNDEDFFDKLKILPDQEEEKKDNPWHFENNNQRHYESLNFLDGAFDSDLHNDYNNNFEKSIHKFENIKKDLDFKPKFLLNLKVEKENDRILKIDNLNNREEINDFLEFNKTELNRLRIGIMQNESEFYKNWKNNKFEYYNPLFICFLLKIDRMFYIDLNQKNEIMKNFIEFLEIYEKELKENKKIRNDLNIDYNIYLQNNFKIKENISDIYNEEINGKIMLAEKELNDISNQIDKLTNEKQFCNGQILFDENFYFDEIYKIHEEIKNKQYELITKKNQYNKINIEFQKLNKLTQETKLNIDFQPWKNRFEIERITNIKLNEDKNKLVEEINIKVKKNSELENIINNLNKKINENDNDIRTNKKYQKEFEEILNSLDKIEVDLKENEFKIEEKYSKEFEEIKNLMEEKTTLLIEKNKIKKIKINKNNDIKQEKEQKQNNIENSDKDMEMINELKVNIVEIQTKNNILNFKIQELKEEISILSKKSRVSLPNTKDEKNNVNNLFFSTFNKFCIVWIILILIIIFK